MIPVLLALTKHKCLRNSTIKLLSTINFETVNTFLVISGICKTWFRTKGSYEVVASNTGPKC